MSKTTPITNKNAKVPAKVPTKVQDLSQGASTTQNELEKFPCHDVYLYHCAVVGVKPNSFVISALSSPLCLSWTLVEMDFSHDYLGEMGAYPLVEVVCQCKSLQRFSLRDTGITNEVGVYIASVAQKHPTLAVVDLSNNGGLSTPSGDAALRAIRWNVRLRNYLLGATNVPKDIIRKIDTLAEQRTSLSNVLDAFAKHVEVYRGNWTPSETHRMCVAVLPLDLATYVRTKVSSSDVFLPQLTSAELSLLKAGYSIAGKHLSFEEAAALLTSLWHRPVTAKDPTLRGADEDKDGLISFAEICMCTRRLMANSATSYRNDQIEAAMAAASQSQPSTPQDINKFCEALKQKTGIEVSGKVKAAMVKFLPNGKASIPQEHFVSSWILAECLVSTTDNTMHQAVLRNKTALKV